MSLGSFNRVRAALAVVLAFVLAVVHTSAASSAAVHLTDVQRIHAFYYVWCGLVGTLAITRTSGGRAAAEGAARE
jgi:hypothetical protein